MASYNEYITRLRVKHGAQLVEPHTAKEFGRYFGMRIEVEGRFGKRRGWVSGTTGWQPALMLLKLRTSTGSSDLLDETDKFIRVIDAGPR